jgi:hypothetical protein
MEERLVVVGCAPCVGDDLHRVGNLDKYDFLAVGPDTLKMVDLPFSYVSTYHPQDIPIIKSFLKNPCDIICHENAKGADIVVPLLFDLPHNGNSGSSSLLGVYFALMIGYTKIILCGCPLEGKNARQQPYEVFQKGWKKYQVHLQDKVRSMSGWTSEFLGLPTEEWLNAI